MAARELPGIFCSTQPEQKAGANKKSAEANPRFKLFEVLELAKYAEEH